MKYTLTFTIFFITFFITKAQCDFNKVLDIKTIKMKSKKKLDTFYFYARIFSLMSASPKLGHLEVSGIANFKW